MGGATRAPAGFRCGDEAWLCWGLARCVERVSDVVRAVMRAIRARCVSVFCCAGRRDGCIRVVVVLLSTKYHTVAGTCDEEKSKEGVCYCVGDVAV